MREDTVTRTPVDSQKWQAHHAPDLTPPPDRFTADDAADHEFNLRRARERRARGEYGEPGPWADGFRASVAEVRALLGGAL